MESKLTINLEGSVLEKANEYARQHNTSLSELIEAYVNELASRNKPVEEITPLVKSLSGVVKVEKEYNYQEAYSRYLSEKYK
ncbi:MAG: hypothetical protein ICV65_05375 [Flavisolibacter sp.]|nr:hypothetical protein [Flavisolibacter sp.]